MKIVIAGGSGHLGRLLVDAFAPLGLELVVLSRHGPAERDGSRGAARTVAWDGRTQGPWSAALDGAQVVINLAGRSVNCRYTAANVRAMFDSRLESTRAVGEAIARAARPPPVWLQASTATIYAHRSDAPNDDVTGELGGHEPDAPAYWKTSIDIATHWELAQAQAPTPRTRKVAMRMAMVMWPGRGGPFETLLAVTRAGLGGALAGGRQFMSWIHGHDLARAVLWLIEHDELDGPVNLAAPAPLPQREFSRVLRAAWGTPIGLPATRWMLEAGAFALRTDTELVFKSRRVVPRRLTDSGFRFDYPEWPAAALDLVARRRGEHDGVTGKRCDSGDGRLGLP